MSSNYFRQVRFLIFSCVLLPVQGMAYDTHLSGFIAGELRGFVTDAQFDEQFDDRQASLIVQPELVWEDDSGDNQYRLIPFARVDSQDSRRTHADIREAYWLHVEDNWELLVGANRVFWGVAESNHLVDVINQTDFVEDIDGEDKLGQPMVNIATVRDWGSLSLFVMPWFRERSFPGRHGRLRFPAVVDGDAQYQSSDEERHVDLALRYSHYLGDWDFGVYYFKGTGREPRLVFDPARERMVAHYDLVNQVGTDIQLTREGWLWKFEGLWRAQHGDHFLAAVGGFEYTLYQILESSADLGLLVEYSWDGRDEDPAQAPPVLLDDDIFLGTRLALNDVQDSELLAGYLIDRDTHAAQFSLEAERRLDNHWNLELESRWFLTSGGGDVVAAFKDDSYVTLRLSRYF